MSKYYVHYVESCSPGVKQFKTKKALKEFLMSFIKKYGSLDDGGDNWIEVNKIYYGTPVKLDINLIGGGK